MTATPKGFSRREFEAVLVKKYLDGTIFDRDPELMPTIRSLSPDWEQDLSDAFLRADSDEQIELIKNFADYLRNRDHGIAKRLRICELRNYATRLWIKLGKGKQWREQRESAASNYFKEVEFVCRNPNPGTLQDIVRDCYCCVYAEVPENGDFAIETRTYDKTGTRMLKAEKRFYVEPKNYHRLRLNSTLSVLVYGLQSDRALNKIEKELSSVPSTSSAWDLAFLPFPV